jgi:hypothetical protein
MRWKARWTVFGAALLVAGMAVIKQGEAADPMPNENLKVLINQDSQNIATLIDMGNKGGKANTSKASRGIKSNAMMIAWFANSRIGGKNAADDAKFATLRDAALKVAVDGGGKKFNLAAPVAKTLNVNIAAAPNVNTNAMTTAQLVAASNMDMEELMYQLKKTAIGDTQLGGLGIEEAIKSIADNRSKITGAEANAMAARLSAICDYCEVLTPTKGFGASTPKKSWDGFLKEMRSAAKGAAEAANGKNAGALPTAFIKLDRSCVACHEMFK